MNLELLATSELVDRAQAEDRDAVEALFHRYYPRVREIVAIRMGPRDFFAREDVVQIALLSVFKNIDKYEARSEAEFRDWVAVCVFNTVRNFIRDEKTAKRGGGKVRPFADFDSSSLTSSVFEGYGPPPNVVAESRENWAQVREALSKLDPPHREIIVLRSLVGMTYEEIGDRMGLEPATARKAMSRAIEKLKRQLGG